MTWFLDLIKNYFIAKNNEKGKKRYADKEKKRKGEKKEKGGETTIFLSRDIKVIILILSIKFLCN